MGDGSVGWVHREPAWAFQYPHPLLLKPPTLVTPVSLQFCTLVLLLLPPGLSTFSSLGLQCPFPQPLCCPLGSAQVPPHPQDALSTCRERWPLPCAAPSRHTYHPLATPRLSTLPAPVVCFCCGQTQENLGVGAEQMWELLGCWEES